MEQTHVRPVALIPEGEWVMPPLDAMEAARARQQEELRRVALAAEDESLAEG